MSKTADRSHFGRALYSARSEAGWTQQQTGSACALTHSAITRAENSPRRPDPATLRALCNCWPSPVTGIRILIAHLEDEINRAGRAQDEVHLRPATDEDHDGGPTRDLAFVAAHDPAAYRALISLIHKIRTLCADASGRTVRTYNRAADGPGLTYTPAKRRRP